MKKITIMVAILAIMHLFGGSMLYAGENQVKMMHFAFRSSDLVGKVVEGHNHEKLGLVEDLVIGPDGQVNYMVISHDEMPGMEDKLTPIPFSAINKEASSGKKIVVDVAKEELKNAPSFARNQWPEFHNSGYGEKLHGYFGPVAGDNINEKLKDIYRTAVFGIPIPM